MGAAGYAKVVPYIRYLLGRRLRGDTLRELLEAGSVADAVSLMPDTIYEGLREARTLRDAEREVWRGYFKAVLRAGELSPGKAYDAVTLPLRLEEAKDLLSLLEASRRGGALEAVERLPTALLESSETSRIAGGGAEVLQSPQRIVEEVRSPVLRRILEGALSFEQRSGVRGAILLYYAPAAARLLRQATATLSGAEARGYESVVCPRITYILVSGVLQAKESGIEARAMDEAFSSIEACGFSWRRVKPIYEREPDAPSLASTISGIIGGWKAEGELPELLEGARRVVRAEIRRRAERAVSGYPFQAGFVAGGLELLRLEAEDLIAVLTGVHLKLKPEEYIYRASLKVTA